MTETLNFGVGNAKLNKGTAILSLPAGHSCPFAKDCRSCAHRETGKIQDGPHTQFRCYAANIEALFRNVRESRWSNFEAVKACNGNTLQMAALIDRSIPRRNGKTTLVRFHQSGDFFSQAYFDAWLMVARQNPGLVFYGYTKALPFWVKRLGDIPVNFHFVASRGGTHDALIEQHGLRSARVVFSEYQARKLKLPIDHDDTHVWKYDGDFAILIHGTQPAGSEAGKAWYKIFKTGKGGYKAGYFNHYKAKGKVRSKIVDGKKIHVKPSVTIGGVHISADALAKTASALKRIVYGTTKQAA